VIYALTFGGDPVTGGALSGEQADRAKADADYWWVRQMVAGKVLIGARLAGPYAATTVRFLEGSRIVEDGPFTAEAECVAGFGIIEATDLDEALAIVRSWPLGGYIEIRPLAQPSMWTTTLGAISEQGDTT
jgi:hypothetical protein